MPKSKQATLKCDFLSLLYSFFLISQTPSCDIYFFLEETIDARSRFSKPFHSFNLILIDSRSFLSSPKLTIAAFIAPFFARIRVICLVSTLVMHGIFCLLKKVFKSELLLQLESSLIFWFNTHPLAWILSDSISILLVPTIPTWGKVNVIICFE